MRRKIFDDFIKFHDNLEPLTNEEMLNIVIINRFMVSNDVAVTQEDILSILMDETPILISIKRQFDVVRKQHSFEDNIFILYVIFCLTKIIEFICEADLQYALKDLCPVIWSLLKFFLGLT